MNKLLTLVLMTMLALTGCGGDEESTSGGSGAVKKSTAPDTTLRINLSDKPSSIDPSLATEVSAHKFLLGIFDPLVRLDKDCKPVPAAASSWEHNADYTKWTFHLREDGKWHNGEPVKAQDFKYAVERLLTPTTRAQYSGLILPVIKGGQEFFDGGGLKNSLSLDSIQTPDDYTITYEMVSPTPYFITFVQLFTFMPIYKPVIEESGDRWALAPETFIGNGPFKLTEMRGKEYHAKKADTYWDRESIFWEEIIYYTIEDGNTEDAAFRTGDLDITEDVTVPELDYWRDKPAYNVHSTFATYYVSFNTKVPPFDDVRVRKAFSKAIDRDLIVSRVTKRNEPVSQGFVPGFLNSARGGTYGEARGDLIGKWDIEEAKGLLAEAGYGSSNPMAPVEYLFNSDDTNKAVGEQIQWMWKEVAGVDVRLQQVEWGTFINRARQHDFESCRASWVGDYLDAMTFLEIFTTGNPKNSPGYSNPEYDRLLKEARYETDPVKREDLMIAAEKLLIEKDCVIAPIYSYISPILVDPSIEGFDRNLIGNFLYTHARRVSRK